MTMANLAGVYIKTLSSSNSDNPRSTILATIKKENVVINLWSPWHDIGEYIQPFTSFRVFNAEKKEKDDAIFYSVGSKSIFIVDSDILINATAINSVSFCPRSYYLNEIVGELPSPYVAIRGSIVHDCLNSAIVSKSRPSEELSAVLDAFSLQYENIGYTKEAVYQDVREMAECLDPFVENLKGQTIPEILFLSPFYGIRGRIDILHNDHIFELKTAKLTEDKEIRFSDLLQVTAYRYGLENFTEQTKPNEGTVIYVGTKKVVEKSAAPNWGLLRYAMIQRNTAYRVSYLGYEPNILPPKDKNKCRNCFVKHYCAIVCAGLNQERNCSTCHHESYCTKKTLPKSHQDYFNKYTRWVREEKNESRRNFSDLWKLKVEQRVAKGKSIDNLVLENETQEIGHSRLLFSCNNQSELREGDIVVLSQGDILKGYIVTGVVSSISGSSIEIILRSMSEKITVVDQYSIDVGFRRQQRGLFNLVFRKNKYKEYVIEEKPPDIKHAKGNYISNNQIQNQAIERILGTQNYCLIQGPAGTGKTYVIAKAAITLANKGEKVLLAAFTNRAVDNICKYLLENGYNGFVRLGETHSIQSEIRNFTLKAYKEKNVDRSITKILEDIPIIVSTTSTISNPIFEKMGIQTVIIDEASQMTETTVLSALIEGDRFVLVGDHKQLPPVIQNPKVLQEGLGISIFERLANAYSGDIHLLTRQFRMNEKLIEFSNNEFYDGKLESFDEGISSQSLSNLTNFKEKFETLKNAEIYNPENPLVFLPTKGVFVHDKKLNKEEARIISEVVPNLQKLGLEKEQLGIICPYRGQVSEIRRNLPTAITVDTVDRFQGSDREIIIISLTESEFHGNKGFADNRRLNVAITRAKKKLIVVGDPDISKGTLGNYMNYLQNNAKIIGTIKQKVESKKPIMQETIIIADRILKKAEEVDIAKLKDKETSNKCIICLEPVYENGIECPLCEHIFHFNHLTTWIKEKERCPFCKTKLTLLSPSS
ncbi:MAG: AAA family ATPase [Asgard group archaeon]|nr:AAA family ATPase [Asgard group archaeon]